MTNPEQPRVEAVDRDLYAAMCQESGRFIGFARDSHPHLQLIAEYRHRLAAETRALEGGGPFQDRVQPWLMACFGEMIAGDREERNHRFLEEALELVQACGCTASEAHQLVDYVYGRPVGEPMQEVGGVMVTLAALCLANGLDMHDAAETELARIWTKVEAIRAKQAAKPKHSPLPEHAESTPQRSMSREEVNRDALIETLKRIDDGVYASLDDRADAILASLALPAAGGVSQERERICRIIEAQEIAPIIKQRLVSEITEGAKPGEVDHKALAEEYWDALEEICDAEWPGPDAVARIKRLASRAMNGSTAEERG